MNKRSVWQVIFNLPNTVGWARLTLFVCFLIFFDRNRLWAGWFYALAATLDAVDGYLARRLQQQTRFGQILDFVLDRLLQCGLLFILQLWYPTWWWFWLSCVLLDVGSHLILVYALKWQSTGSHKQVSVNMPPLLRCYYESRWVLFTLCFIYEFCLWVLLMGWQFVLPEWLWVILAVGFLLKLLVHVLQIVWSLRGVLQRDCAQPLVSE